MKKILLLLILFGLPIFNYTQTYVTNASDAVSTQSPLHWAAAQGYVEMIKVILDKGYDINLQDQDGFTPLHYAAAAGKYPAVEFLVKKGADVYRLNKQNMTPMALAARAGEQKIVDFLFIKMRSVRVDQLKTQEETKRVNSDLIKAAKSRAEAEKLRRQAEEWTKEANYWKQEAEKWNREALRLKDQQIQVDQIAKERLNQMMQEKMNTEQSFKAEKLARGAAERLLREQSANTEAQLRAYEAQNAALSAKQATEVAIDNLADEFLRQGIQYDPRSYRPDTTAVPNSVPSGYQKTPLPQGGQCKSASELYFLESNAPSVSVDIINQIPVPADPLNLDLGKLPSQLTNLTNLIQSTNTNATNTNFIPMFGGTLPPNLTNLNFPDPVDPNASTQEEDEYADDEVPAVTEVTEGLSEEDLNAQEEEEYAY
ncbi:MAG: ankyrin repeat domain-containing protein [Brevinemataceae bacterium]